MNTPVEKPELPVPLGKCQATPGALDAARELGVNIQNLLARHASRDWGDLSKANWAENDRAVRDGNRLLSSYRFSDAVKFWVITEHDRSYTTVMLPDEY